MTQKIHLLGRRADQGTVQWADASSARGRASRHGPSAYHPKQQRSGCIDKKDGRRLDSMQDLFCTIVVCLSVRNDKTKGQEPLGSFIQFFSGRK